MPFNGVIVDRRSGVVTASRFRPQVLIEVVDEFTHCGFVVSVHGQALA
ncbi:hypothetical protein ACQEVF_58470 [Nonomuraea polychroma]